MLQLMDQPNNNFMNATVQLIFGQVSRICKADALTVTEMTKMANFLLWLNCSTKLYSPTIEHVAITLQE